MHTRVLLVDEDEELRGSLTRALRARALGVDAFASADAVLTAVDAGASWNHALISLSLQEMTGAELGEKLRARLPSVELTFSTKGADARVLCHAHALGVVVFEPFGIGPLCERFCRSMRQSGVTTRAVRSAQRERSFTASTPRSGATVATRSAR